MRAAAVSAGVVTAGVTFAVMVMAAMEITSHIERSIDESFGDFIDIAFSSSDNFDSGIGERIDCSAADTAADQGADTFDREQAGECSVAGAAGRETFFSDDFAIFYFKDGKSRSVSEMLEYLIIFTCNGNFH